MTKYFIVTLYLIFLIGFAHIDLLEPISDVIRFHTHHFVIVKSLAINTTDFSPSFFLSLVKIVRDFSELVKNSGNDYMYLIPNHQ